MIDKSKIQSIFEDFNNLRVIIIGDVMIDSYIWGKVERISPEAPVPIVNVAKREKRLGGAANVALNIKALGAKPILCSIIGNDYHKAEFIDLLKQDQLPEYGILDFDDRRTTVKFRIIGNNNHLLRVDEEDQHNISENQASALFQNICKIIESEKIDAIIFEDYDKGVITENLIKKVIETANIKGIPTIIDPKKNNFYSYKNVSIFKPNLKELREGTKIDFNPKNTAELSEIVQKLQVSQNIKKALITLSEEGVFISEKLADNSFSFKKIPAHLRNIADVSGAGDTLISVSALCEALNLDAETNAALSNIAGGLVCEEVGVIPINKSKLLNEALKLL
ncbi:MAG: D-glycero-beta-D-manno-heptose-7-phosphate kinase [Bacteroidetes bacterium]|nr:D-glycero-beta-D-manno-heptose-7-phosphate kinase [Bacteroidota bacterium]